jgi:hypothetical protein
MPLTRFRAEIPLLLDCPEPMQSAVEYVLKGEYESGHDGTFLDILDLGANIKRCWRKTSWPFSTKNVLGIRSSTTWITGAN